MTKQWILNVRWLLETIGSVFFIFIQMCRERWTIRRLNGINKLFQATLSPSYVLKTPFAFDESRAPHCIRSDSARTTKGSVLRGKKRFDHHKDVGYKIFYFIICHLSVCKTLSLLNFYNLFVNSDTDPIAPCGSIRLICVAPNLSHVPSR